MKAIINISIIFAYGLVACNKDFLDTKIDTNPTPNTIITDRATLYTFGNAFYAALPNGFSALDSNLFAAASDEAQQSLPVSNAQLFNQGAIDPNSNPDAGAYKKFYDGIRAANFYLQYSEGYKEFIARNRDTVSDVVNYNRDKLMIGWYRAEAHIARAYYYFELIKRYGAVPLITETYSNATNLYVNQTSYNDMVNFIVSEINTYKDSLQTNWRTSSFSDQDGRFSKGAALAIKSRVLLYAASPLNNTNNDAAKWRLAAEAARDVITTAGLNYVLFTGSYGAYFTGNNALNNAETIFAVRRPAGNAPEANNYPIATPGGNSGIAPTQNLVSEFELIGAADPADPYKNRDPRLAATIVTNGSTWNGRVVNQSPGGTDDMTKANASPTGYYLKKFLTDNLNLTQGGTAQHNWILFRFAETLLNYAEAMNEAYGPDATPTGYPYSARQALQMVRMRASAALPAVTDASMAGFRNAVKHERRVELAFEDHRYWDLLRWKEAEAVLNQPVRGVRITKNPDNSYNYQVVNVSGRTFRAPAMYLYPFTQNEVVNGKGSLVQNGGY